MVCSGLIFFIFGQLWGIGVPSLFHIFIFVCGFWLMAFYSSIICSFVNHNTRKNLFCLWWKLALFWQQMVLEMFDRSSVSRKQAIHFRRCCYLLILFLERRWLTDLPKEIVRWRKNDKDDEKIKSMQNIIRTIEKESRRDSLHLFWSQLHSFFLR